MTNISRQIHTKKKYEDINAHFDKMIGEKEEINGQKVRVYSFDYCYAKTASKFYVSVSTVKKVVNGWVG